MNIYIYMNCRQKRYCVLEGSMLVYYGSQRDSEAKGKPKGICEIVQVKKWNGHTNLHSTQDFGFEFSTILGKVYHCVAESEEDCTRWMDGIQMALDEPDKIVQEENDVAYKELMEDAEREKVVVLEAAEQYKVAKLEGSRALSVQQKLSGMEDKWKVQYDEYQELLDSLHFMKECHDDEDIVTNVEDVQVKVDDAKSALDALTVEKERVGRELQILQDEAERLRIVAANTIEKVVKAKALSKLHADGRLHTPSHVDTLAEGYLQYKTGNMMHLVRKYFALHGRTLSLYDDFTNFEASMVASGGVYHVVDTKPWSGKVGLHHVDNPFEIVTLEGKILHCSAPLKQDVDKWTTGIQIGVTMPPMSPERASKARHRRIVYADVPGSTLAAHDLSVDEQKHIVLPDENCLQGYLIKKSRLVPKMKRTYCVLKKNMLYFYHKNQDYERNGKPIGHIEVEAALEWDGVNLLKTYKHGFRFESYTSKSNHTHAVHCSAMNEMEQEKWLFGAQYLLSYFAMKQVFVDHIAKIDHQLVMDVDTQLRCYHGREEDLISFLDNRIGTTLGRVKTLPDVIDKYQHACARKEAFEKLHGPIFENLNACQNTTRNCSIEHLNDHHLLHQGYLLRKGSNKDDSLCKMYFVLHENRMLAYQDAADAEASSFDEYDSYIDAMEVSSVQDWNGKCLRDTVANGFQVAFGNGVLYYFSCNSAKERAEWIDKLHVLLKAPLHDQKTKMHHEGYLAVKHGHIGKHYEHYCILHGVWFTIWKSKEETYGHEYQDPTISKVEVVGLNHIKNLSFTIETLEHDVYNCTAHSNEEAAKWTTKISKSIESINNEEVISRNASLPSVPNASLEGYVKKKGIKFRAFRNRYAVLLGCHIMFYESQQDAIDQHHILGDFIITDVASWDHRKDAFDLLAEKVKYHGFNIQTNTDRIIQCVASNTAERNIWMEAIRHEVDQSVITESKLQDALLESKQHDLAIQKAHQTYASVQNENAAESTEISNLLQDITWDSDDEPDNGIYSTVNEKNHEIPTKKSTQYEPTPSIVFHSVPLRSNDSNVKKLSNDEIQIRNNSWLFSFWNCFSCCSLRNRSSAMIEPLLSDDQRAHYQCDYYASGYES